MKFVTRLVVDPFVNVDIDNVQVGYRGKTEMDTTMPDVSHIKIPVSLQQFPMLDNAKLFKVKQGGETADLPTLSLTYINENGERVTIKLSIETDITAYELSLITQLVWAKMANSIGEPNVFKFIKMNNLERHFKYG
jgi:hypothetical protein